MNTYYTDCAVVVLAMVAIFIFIFAARWVQEKICPHCHYPTRKCVCHKCRHHHQGKTRWTQDGWIAHCHDCHEIVYKGDDYENGPK